jgi:hypothetical protein
MMSNFGFLGSEFFSNIKADAKKLCNKGFLVYPKTSSSPITAPGIYHKGHKDGKDNMSCQVIYVDVVRDGMVNERVGMDLFNNLQIRPFPSH